MMDPLHVEGLAAQIYANVTGQGYVWWHLLREDLREKWRRAAREKIADFERRYSLEEKKK